MSKICFRLPGPVNVLDYKQTVDANNFFQIAETNSEDSFFPGSTQKRDFLRSFYNSLKLTLSQKNDLSYSDLLQSVASSIYEKHLLFTFNNVNEQAIFAVNGWSSALIDERPIDDSTLNDFMGVNEANLGVDKVNYYVSRSLSQNVNIALDGTVNETLNIAIKNSATKNSGRGEYYKNYLRIILPFNATIANIQIDGKNQQIVPAITDPSVYEKKGFVPPQGLEVEREDQGQNTIYGFLTILQPQDLRTIRVSYKLAGKINLSSPDLLYSLKVFKQPGVDFYPFDFSLSLPSGFKILSLPSDVQNKGQEALLSTQISRDREIDVNFAPQ